MAVTSDANGIYVDNGTYSFADIYATAGIGGVDFLRVDSGTGFRTYRSLKTIFVGQTVSTGSGTSNATTLQDSNCSVTFDDGKRIQGRTGNNATLAFTFGTKIGTGSSASGQDGVNLLLTNTAGANSLGLRGTVNLYGCTFQSTASAGTQQLSMLGLQSGSEMMGCTFQGFNATTAYQVGAAANPMDSAYNIEFVASPSQSHAAAFVCTSAERITFAGNPGLSYLQNGTLVGRIFKDLTFFGTPGVSDIRWTNTGSNWNLVRPTWSGNAPKFSGNLTVGTASAFYESWLYDIKCVDGTGVGVSGIPVKLTDTVGNVQVDTTTGSDGEISFGSGLTTNTVIVADHYNISASTYAIQHRSPFLVEINMPYQTGYQNGYMSHRYYFYWPGYETVTTSAGTFEDVNDVIQMAAAPSGGSTWVERIVP